MSWNIEWLLSAKHDNGDLLSGAEIDEMLEKIQEDVDSDIMADYGEEYFLNFSTFCYDDDDVIRSIVAKFTAAHPDVEVHVAYKFDTQMIPDKTVYRNGLDTEYSGHIQYTKDNRTDDITEYCSHCDEEQIVRFDLNAGHLQSTCPKCGNRLMLCTVCPCRGGIGECDWTKENGCKYRKKEEQ